MIPQFNVLKQVIIFLFLCCIGCCVRSQDQSYLFSSISVKDGLYQESVNLVQQDARGFIWIAAGEVLQRFDRYRFTNLSPSQTNTFALPPGNIRSLMIDKKNRLWMLKGDSSFGYINPDDFTFHKVRIVAPTRFNQLPTALHVAQDGTILLIYVGKGIITYNEKANEAAEKYNPFFLPQGWEPTHLYQDKELNYWLGTPKGLLKYNARNGKMSYNGHNEDNDPFIDRLKEFKDIGFVYIDIKKTIWFHTRQLPKSFVGSYNTQSRELTNWVDIMNKDKDSYYECQGVSETSDGSIWMAGPNFFARADETEKKIFHIKTNQADRNSIWYDNVYSLFEDREHNIWITTNKGLYYFNPNAQVFKTVPNRLLGKDVPYKAEVSDILELADGRILVATWGNGVFCYDKNFNPVIDNIFNQKAPSGLGLTWCLMQRKNGDIWCGIQAGNIEIYEAASGKNYRIQPKELEGRTVRQLAEDSAGNVWIGSHGGHLIKMDAQTKSFSLQHHFKAVISRLFIDRSRQLWVTTDSKGVYQLNPQNATIIAHYTSNSGPNKSMRINGAADITQLNDSTMVIVADGMYFLDLRSQTFNGHSKQNILPNNNVSNVVIDKHNNIWTTTGSGICSYHLPKSKLSIYTDVDGVRTYSFNVASSCRLRNGKIVFGTNHDCILFNPDEVLVNNYKVPVVQIAGISILNKTDFYIF